MKQKLLTLLLFVIAIYIIFPSGGDPIVDETASSSQFVENNFDGDYYSYSDVLSSDTD